MLAYKIGSLQFGPFPHYLRLAEINNLETETKCFSEEDIHLFRED